MQHTKNTDSTPPPAAEPLAKDISEQQGLGALALLTLLLARKRLIIGLGLCGGVIAAGISLLLPNTYTAAALIMPPQKDQNSASAMLGQLGSLAALAGAEAGLKTPGDLYVGLLGSRTIADRVIERFRLKAIYGTKTDTDTRAKLHSRARFSSGLRDGLVRIEVEDTDPRRAAAIANTFLSELNVQNSRLATTDAGQRRAFLEKQLADEKLALAEAEDAMKKLQSRTGLIQLDGQTTVAIGSLAQLRAQITADEVALERLRMGATPQNPDVLRLKAELEALRTQFGKLENSSDRSGSLPSTSALPRVGLEYIRCLRDLKYHEFLFELLSKQYEAARLDEGRAAPSIQVVDSAVPPDRKSGPFRSLLVFLGVLGAGILGSTIACYQEFQRSASIRTPGSETRG